METTNITVDGMDCASCAISIKKSLQKQGLEDVKVNYASGDVSFINTPNLPLINIEKEIKELGYTVVGSQQNTTEEKKNLVIFKSSWNRFLFCIVFTAPLFISHLIHIHWLMNPVVQLALTTPVYFVGMMYFWKECY